MKNKRDFEKLFCENYEIFIKSMEWLEKSYKKCKNFYLNNCNNFSEQEIEALETLSNRFCRSNVEKSFKEKIYKEGIIWKN